MHLIYGLLDLPLWAYFVVTAVMMHLTVLGVTLYLHRDQTHRGLDLHASVRHFFRFWLWLSTGINTCEWVAVHRKHHAKVETEEDPHSPVVMGIGKVFFEGAELYRVEAAKAGTVEKYGKGTPNDWLERNVYYKHRNLGPIAMLVIDLVLLGVPGLTVWAVQMLTIPILAAGVINGIGHYWGYRNYECKDAATNITPWGVIMGGEELHNNHHAFPSSARFSMRRWELDLGWWYISALRAVGLAKVRRVAPRPVIDTPQKADVDTVRAVILNRFHVLRDYGRHVIKPVLKDESQHQPFLAKARKVLIRDHQLLDGKAQAKLDKALKNNRALRTVYEYRQQLQQLWEGKASSNDSLVQQLHDWCVRAEQSGIESLQEFSRQLQGYRIRTA